MIVHMYGVLLLLFIIDVAAYMHPASAIPHCSENYRSIRELKTFCKESGFCSERLCCEGKEVKVKGYLNGINIFHRKTYPNVIQPKFQIIDGPGIQGTENSRATFSESLEIYPVRGDIEALFERLISHRELPLTLLCIKGTVRGFDAPTNSGKYRLYHLIVGAEDVLFDGGSCGT
jgi:hypothetical protein